MFFSKVSLLPSMQAQQALVRLQKNGAYAAHQLLWRLFTEHQERPFLFRDDTQSHGFPQFWVLSSVAPEDSSGLFQVQSKTYSPQLAEGDRLAYKLRANPTVSTKDSDGKAKRHDVLMHAKKQALQSGKLSPEPLAERMNQAAQSWICKPERLDHWGVSMDMAPDIEGYCQHEISKRQGQHQIKYSSVDYQGVLTVQDPARFTEVLFNGVGKAKSFGCGLLLVRRV